MKKQIKNLMNKFKFKKGKKAVTFKSKEVFVLISLSILVSLACGILVGYRFDRKLISNKNSEALNEFLDNYNYIVENYYGEIDEEKMLDSAIRGVLESLGDPFSNYIDENDVNFNIRLNGTFEGIGVEMLIGEDGYIDIVGILNNSPAKTIGLKVGDTIMSIDNITFKDEPASAISTYIRENDGPYNILIKRDNKELLFVTDKAPIVIESVSHKLYEKDYQKIGYIRVSIFAANTYDQFEEAVKDLESKGIDSLIIDLRDNGGGHLSVVREMASLFLRNDKVVYQTEDKSGIKKVYSLGNKNATYQIVLLGNQASASASEVMIAALKDNLGATFIGEKTYGKGTVQELQTLSDGSSYKFTIKKWLTPKGVWINGVGISPDTEVIASDEYHLNPTEENDNQLQNAFIRLVP